MEKQKVLLEKNVGFENVHQSCYIMVFLLNLSRKMELFFFYQFIQFSLIKTSLQHQSTIRLHQFINQQLLPMRRIHHRASKNKMHRSRSEGDVDLQNVVDNNKRRSKSNKQFNNNKKHPQLEKASSNILVEKCKIEQMGMNEQLQMLKDLYNKIVIAPQDNIKYLQTMFTIVKNNNLKVVATALRVLAETFVNIAPLQAIDVGKLQERTQNKISKDEYKVIKFQKNLVEQYDKYIKILKQMLIKTRPINFNNDKQIYKQFKKCILQCVIKCYRTLWNFNYNKQINQLCFKFIKHQECKYFIKQMLADKNISLITIKLNILNAISKLIKNQQHQQKLPSDIIKILNFTYIDTRYLKKDQQSIAYKKKKIKRRKYREEAKQQKESKNINNKLELKKNIKEQKAKQKLKIKDQINKQFAEGDTTIQNKQIVKNNSKILQNLFYIYFKILIQRTHLTFFKDSLDGILKFVHYINIELTQSLIEHLDQSAYIFRDNWKINKCNEYMQIRILIVFSGQSIINGPLSIYNLDDIKMSTHFYKIMKDLNTKTATITKQIYRLICITLDEMFIKRRQLSQQIVGSLVREIAMLVQNYQYIPKLYLLQIIRIMAYKYDKISRMFEEDNQGFGLNSFNSHCEDPQCSNAINTEIIHFLKKCKSKHSVQYQNSINSIVKKLLSQNFKPKDSQQSLFSILQKQMKDGFFQEIETKE